MVLIGIKKRFKVLHTTDIDSLGTDEDTKLKISKGSGKRKRRIMYNLCEGKDV